MTQHPDLFAALAAPFGVKEVKSRSQGGKQISYITARVVMNRLDDVVGPENWWNEFAPAGDNSILCKLTIRLPDGQVLTKCDAGGHAGMADSGDDDKSAHSDALKRAAVLFGVGRYLYNDGTPAFVRAALSGQDEPAIAEPTPAPRPSNGHANGHQAAARGTWGGKPSDKTPRSGKALFGWVKDREQQHGVGLLKYLNNWAKLQEFPARMVDWDTDQVKLAHAEACRKLSAREPAGVAG